jgi:hypothetical protein
MIDIKVEKKQSGKAEKALIEEHGSYWRRAFHDWRFLMAVFVLLTGLVTYLMTGDLIWKPHGDWFRTVEKTDKPGTDLPPVTRVP